MLALSQCAARQGHFAIGSGCLYVVTAHALVRDAAYGTLLREPRRALHAHIAETLESQFADIVESQPELLARHCMLGGCAQQWRRFLSRRPSSQLPR